MKPRRIVNEELLAVVRTLPCMACGIEPAGHAHHVTSRGAGGDDVPENLMPLCPAHHSEWHQCPSKMIARYPVVRCWLEAAGRKEEFAAAFPPE